MEVSDILPIGPSRKTRLDEFWERFWKTTHPHPGPYVERVEWGHLTVEVGLETEIDVGNVVL